MKEVGALAPIPLYRLKSFLMRCTVEVPLLVSLAIVQGVFSSNTLGQNYEIFIAEKHNSINKRVFLPKYLDNRNKYITFAA